MTTGRRNDDEDGGPTDAAAAAAPLPIPPPTPRTASAITPRAGSWWIDMARKIAIAARRQRRRLRGAAAQAPWAETSGSPIFMM